MYNIYKASKMMTTYDLIRCPQRICFCIEYLDYSKRSSFTTYRNCFITKMLNKKFENQMYENKKENK